MPIMGDRDHHDHEEDVKILPDLFSKNTISLRQDSDDEGVPTVRVKAKDLVRKRQLSVSKFIIFYILPEFLLLRTEIRTSISSMQ